MTNTEIGKVTNDARAVASSIARPRRAVISLSGIAVLLFMATWTCAADDGFQSAASPLLKQYCLDCHGAEKQESNVRFDNLDGFAVGDRNLWTMVHEKISAGEMPPEDRPQPSDAAKKQLLSWIERQQRSLGTGSTRRLNRRELSGALQDLTGLPVDFAAGLPGDGKLAGFDTGASALQDSASSIDQMMRVTRRAVDGIRFLEPSSGPVFRADLLETKDARKALDAWKEQGAESKVRGYPVPGVGLHLEPKWLGDRDGLEVYVPAPADGRGLLRLTLVAAVKKYFDGVPNPHLWVKVGGKAVDYREITGTTEQPQELVYVVQLEDVGIGSKGVKIFLASKIEVPYGVKGFENENKSKEPIPGGQSLFRPMYNRKERSPEKHPAPFVVLRSIQVEPDYVAAWPPVGRALLPVKDDSERTGKSAHPTISDDLSSAKKLLAFWVERAWRRPVSDAEQERFLTLYQKLRGQKFTFDEALRAAFHSVLLSPPFRYLPSAADDGETIAQHAIASRLSFMLWGGPPDDELRQLASAGRLRDPRVLNEQVDRLLTDPRSDAFIRPFVMQWLELDQPITVTQDHIGKQDFRFGRHLKESMKEETVLYIARLFRENRPANELIDSDWTMMNESLAHHYGYDGIEGAHLRPVTLRKDDPRGGGILSHAGIQSMLCWMGDNWVIYRGAWALRHILDDPPPPPPLDVPELDPSAGNNRGKSFKELLKQHQEDAKCAVCHKSMDPLGFAFQNFDVSGRWRDVEFDSYAWGGLDGKKVWNGKGKSRPVDTIGHLPRGEEFATYVEFKDAFLKNYMPDLTRGVLKNLMVYATGRKPDVDDMAEIRAILKEQQSKGYPLGDLLKAVVRSKAFLEH